MFSVYSDITRFAFSAENLDEVKLGLVRYGFPPDSGSVAILEDGKPYQIWFSASWRTMREIYVGTEGYRGWFPITRRKWDTWKGGYTQETYKTPVAIFTGGFDSLYRTFAEGVPKEVQVDQVIYRVENVCNHKHVFTLDGMWLGEFQTTHDNDGWYEIVRSVRKPTPPGMEFYPFDWRYGDRKVEVKWAASEKGAVRLIVKLVSQLDQATTA